MSLRYIHIHFACLCIQQPCNLDSSFDVDLHHVDLYHFHVYTVLYSIILYMHLFIVMYRFPTVTPIAYMSLDNYLVCIWCIAMFLCIFLFLLSVNCSGLGTSAKCLNCNCNNTIAWAIQNNVNGISVWHSALLNTVLQVVDKCTEAEPVPECISLHPGFAGCCLNPWVQQMTYMAMYQRFGAGLQGEEEFSEEWVYYQ